MTQLQPRNPRSRLASLATPLASLAWAALCVLPCGGQAKEIAELFERGQVTQAGPTARQLVDRAFGNLFAPGYVMSIETIRTDADGNSEAASFRVLRRSLGTSVRILTESLTPLSVSGTRILQVERSDGGEITFAHVRSLDREPFETTFRMADPFLCTWYEKQEEGLLRAEPGLGRHQILARRPDEIAGEPVQRVLVRPFIPRGYDRIELAIAERDYAILEYLHFLAPDDLSPSLIARANREDMIEIDGRVVPKILRYDDRILGDVVFVTVAHAALPPDVPDLLFDPRSFHRVNTDGLPSRTEPPAP